MLERQASRASPGVWVPSRVVPECKTSERRNPPVPVGRRCSRCSVRTLPRAWPSGPGSEAGAQASLSRCEGSSPGACRQVNQAPAALPGAPGGVQGDGLR